MFLYHYCCPHVSHEGIEKLHILLCEKHKKENRNIKLLEKFKAKFIDNCKVPLPQCSKHLSCFSDMVGVTKVVKGNGYISGATREKPMLLKVPFSNYKLL